MLVLNYSIIMIGFFYYYLVSFAFLNLQVWLELLSYDSVKISLSFS